MLVAAANLCPAEYNCNFGEGNGSGREIMMFPAIVVALSLTATGADAKTSKATAD